MVRRRGQGRPEEQDHPALAKRGTRPSAPHDQRTASTDIFGAICPKEGKGAALVLPWCNTEGIALDLAAISAKLAVPANITLVPLPPKCPELNAQENMWQFMRDNWLSNRVFTSYDTLLDHCCAAWNKLADQPWTIMSLGLRDWAHRFQSGGLGISAAQRQVRR